MTICGISRMSVRIYMQKIVIFDLWHVSNLGIFILFTFLFLNTRISCWWDQKNFFLYYCIITVIIVILFFELKFSLKILDFRFETWKLNVREFYRKLFLNKKKKKIHRNKGKRRFNSDYCMQKNYSSEMKKRQLFWISSIELQFFFYFSLNFIQKSAIYIKKIFCIWN